MDFLFTLALLSAVGVTAGLVVAVWWLVLRPLRLAAIFRSQGSTVAPFVPLVGNLPGLIKEREELVEAFYKTPQRWGEKYGDRCVIFLGPEVRVLLTEPDLIREVLVTHSYVFDKTPFVRSLLEHVLGQHSLLLSGGAHHKRSRRVVSSAFHNAALQSLVPLMTECAVLGAERWAAQLAASSADRPSGAWTELEASTLVMQVTLDIIGQSAFATEKARGGDGAPVYAVVAQSVDERSNGAASIGMLIPGWRWLPTPSNRKTSAHIRAVRAVALELVKERRALRSVSDAASGARTTLLDLLLAARETEGDSSSNAPAPSLVAGGEQGLSDDEVVDQAVTFLLAGHETTSQAITWALYLLAQNPEWQSRLRAEVWRVCGCPSSTTSPPSGPAGGTGADASAFSPTSSFRAPTYADIGELTELSWVLQETLRLYPPASVMSRMASSDVTLEPKGSTSTNTAREQRPLHVPAGACVHIPIALLHRDARFWDAPHEFLPERWKNGTSAACKHPFAYLPFSFGARNCIGSQFALLEAKAVLAVILQRFEWTLSPSYVHKPAIVITLQPRHGMQLLVRTAVASTASKPIASACSSVVDR